MAFQARHRWIIQRLHVALDFKDEGEVEELLKQKKTIDQLTAFFKEDGPVKIFFYYQSRQNDSDALEEATVMSASAGKDNRKSALFAPPPPVKELFITDGTEDPLLEKAVYFAKNIPKIQSEGSQGNGCKRKKGFALDPAVANDDLLISGTVDPSILLSLETLLDGLYSPLLSTQSDQKWGQTEPEVQNDFLVNLKAFTGEIQENLKSMNAGLELRKPDKCYDPSDLRSFARLSTDEVSVSHFVELVQEWSKQTESYLDENDQGRWESSESGPNTELEYWKRRLQRLTGITEQLKTKECKMVINVLTAVTKQQEMGLDRQSIFSLLKQWKHIDVNITEAANEAKDNVKYLATLEKFIEPLHTSNPAGIIDALPGLMNSVKMIHTIARYYNTTERMTKLFMKITNQMICQCKKSILGSNLPDKIWEKDPELLLEELESCLRLNEAYQEQYRLTKDKLLTMPKGKQFDFSETQIFGKFDLFCRRIIKLIDMFSTIHQFRSLAEHSLEGMEPLISTFDTIISEFKSNKHDLLDYHNNKFDRDYVEFNVRISDLESSLQHFINQSFESITSIEQSLNLLKQFQTILQRESLRSDLDSKFTVIFHNYGLDLTTVQEIYEKYRHNPPIARNMPPVAGNILWSRHLLRRIEDPMRKFESNPSVLATKDSKKIIKTYNKVARTLVAFEYLWYEAWCKSIEKAKAGLHATLIIRHPSTAKLYVNFDKEILQLIREAKCLDRMGIEIPENAKMVMLQEDKFKNYYNDLMYALKEYDRVISKIIPVTEELLTPHLNDVEYKIRPGMITLTWTSMNIDAYKLHVHSGLQHLEELVNNVNDIIENRIEKNLKIISKAVLVNLPKDQSFALDDFVRMQERHVTNITILISAKNTEIENAVEDVLTLITSYNLDSLQETVEDPENEKQRLKSFRKHYNNLIYRALLNSTKQSLNAVKKRVCAKVQTGFLFVERPFFEVDVQLSVPSVRLSPSLNDVQKAINRSAVAVLKCSKNIYAWGQQNVFPESERLTFFQTLGCDTEIIKVAILLTGALHGTKNQVHDYLATFKKYDWLWKEDMEFRYNQFMKRNPNIQDFENELTNFMAVEDEINHVPPVHNIGALSLNTKNLKLQLRNECRQWKVQYSDRVHQQARTAMTNLTDYIRITTTKLGYEVDSLDSLRFVMNVLREVRERESSIEMEINPILDMYQMLENYLPGGYMDKEEMDQKSIIRSSWRKLVDYAEDITDNLSDVQGVFKKKLMKDVKEFQVDAIQFRNDYISNGPMVSGLKPTEAVARLKRFKDELMLRDRKLEVYSAGEELFGMRTTEYPELTKTKKELTLLDQLYNLYMDVVNTMDEYKNILWSQVSSSIDVMFDTVNAYDLRCKRLPKKLCEWEAYRLLRREINDFLDILPIIQELSKESVKSRHWHEVIKVTGIDFQFDSDSFKLKIILESNLLPFKDDLEYICESAAKQLQIENKLNDIKEMWAGSIFEFSISRARDVPLLKSFPLVIEDLEDAQLQLQTMLSMRHVTPFKDTVQAKLSQLSDTSDILELWVKVQTLWTSLESVFTGGDIAKQMPLEAKKFAKVDKDWIKIMQKASETGNVVICCGNELLKNTLPILYGELEKCQKSLEGYLEQKRTRFPRFYFVSNPVLLQVLSHGSDLNSVQQYIEKLFDSIDKVIHDHEGTSPQRSGSSSLEKKKILKFMSIVGSDQEIVELGSPVVAEGNIEDWLINLEREMQRTLKNLCKTAASECSTLQLRDFVNKHCGQFALLGLQFDWTAMCQEALLKCRNTKGIMLETNKKQGAILSELSSWCLTDLGTVLNRTKIEALVTIQVHQRDCFAELVKLFKERKIQDANDFEWLKQARFYWRTSPVVDRHGPEACLISICDVDFKYAFEYLGCKERLVITPLTDRAYVTLSQALGMYLGGAPAGPAGTGKTETVKDLGRSLGIYVVVTNCTDQQRYTDMAKIFKGLCQAGLWGCFDEFNRIELPVLSVVAQQVLAITNAKRLNVSSFCFPGDSQVISLNSDVGYFITMNPGYQGRQELPENLKALFRGVSMMVPDREIIMKVKLCSVGYTHFIELARKFKTLYGLCEEQLSKQKHYDFGLRNILSILRAAGKIKRENLDADESMLLMRTLRDMNLSKLVAQDIPLFLSLLKDLFPSVDQPASRNHDLVMKSIATVVEKKNLTFHEPWIIKVIQLFETLLVRHGIMLVGPAGAGKSEIFRTLQGALSEVNEIPHKQIRMNPKAIRAEEMFGETDKLSGEWLDGVFASIWSKFNDRSRKDISWIVCDGPVDAIWIENLNTVLDDNKILTLANGDRIPMTENCKLMFEVEDLRNASPATVSRAGIVFVSDSDLDWKAVMLGWLNCQANNLKENLKGLFLQFVGENDTKEIGHLFSFLNKSLNPVIQCSRVGLIKSCLHLLSGMLSVVELSDSKEDMGYELERVFLYSLGWSVGGILDSHDRILFNNYLQELTANLPENGTVFTHYINHDTLEWERWVPDSWTYPQADEVQYSQLIVPTVDSCRVVHLLKILQDQMIPTMMVGGSGTAKTTTAQIFFDDFNSELMILKKVIFSSATLPGMFQLNIEGELDKRGGKNFGPPSGKKMTVFLDDISMPQLNDWGDQPTLEIVRQLVESKGMCFLDKDRRGDIKIIEDLQYVAAMSHPGGGKNDIPNRLKRHFFIFNMITPSNEVIDSIYGQMLQGRFMKIKGLHDISKSLTGATIQIWSWLKKTMLPTPQKFHYIFNMFDLSRIFQGILSSPLEIIVNDKILMKLWRHECERVFSDRLINRTDIDRFKDEMSSIIEANISVKMSAKEKHETTVFVPFLKEDKYDDDGILVEEAKTYYELSPSTSTLRAHVLSRMSTYNKENPSKCLNLILFDDALSHLTRIARILGMPRGNLMLVGVGGSGKQSLTRLASILCRNTLFQITLTKSYTSNSFLDDLRALYKLSGQQGKEITFLLTDNDIQDDNFLEYINSMLITGEVMNLFPKDELNLMAAELRPLALKIRQDFNDTPENLVKFFIDRVMENLHLVLCMSPVDSKFPDRCRMFPGLISGCTIDWFLPWPEEALIAVSRGYLENYDMECDSTVKDQLVLHMGLVHGMIVEVCDEYFQKFRRYIYQTPKSFLSFLVSYKEIYASKLKCIKQKESSINLGLLKLVQGAADVDKMKLVLKDEELKLNAAEAAANVMLENLQIKSMEAKKENDIVKKIKEQCLKDAQLIGEEKKNAEEDLAKAQPYLDEAERAVSSIKPNDLNELKKLAKPGDIIKLIFDCVAILKMYPLVKVEKSPVILGIGKEKKNFDFILDSYQIIKSGMLADARFLQNIFHFSKFEKDYINDETIELMQPYLNLEGFNPAVAKNASKAAEGLCSWVKAMTMYQHASKVVKPKLEALRLAEGRLESAHNELGAAEETLQKCQSVLNELQTDFENQMAEKALVEENAHATKKKMDQATALIDGLAGERVRWLEESKKFAERKLSLVGDCALACAFVSYCGPFNKEFRDHLVTQRFMVDLSKKKICVTSGLDLSLFLVDLSIISDWNMQGLPTDSLSTQNGILVEKSSRFPLLVDPQGQALTWILNREADNLPNFGITMLSNTKLKDQIEYCLSEGKALIIHGIEKEVDPVLNPILEKNVIIKAKSKYVLISDKLCEYSDNFRMYMATRLPNPHFSPELQARTTIVDFTVTQRGLEEQLLGKVIQKEQKSLEEQLTRVQFEVNSNTKSLLLLDALLLERLTANEGNLLDDLELITVLAETKLKATDVNDKLLAAEEVKKGIDEKREQYRPVATRGSVLYFCIVDLSLVNCMYQTSLDQMLALFIRSMDVAERSNLASKRVNNIIDSMTYLIYRYVNRGIYEKDKLSYILMMTLKILVTANCLNEPAIKLFLKAGGGLDINSVDKKPFAWLTNQSWLNAVQLATDIIFFKNLLCNIERNEAIWKCWYEDNEPEKLPIPDYESLLVESFHGDLTNHFLRMLLVRSLREDRTILAINDFIRSTDVIDCRSSAASNKLPVMGLRYVEPVTDTMESLLQEMTSNTPVIFLSSSGSDPTDSIENLARKKRQSLQCVSMGEGQEPVAMKAVNASMVNSSWVLLQNCHLGLNFMEVMDDLLGKINETMGEFRIFITTDAHPDFPISLLQKSIKVTNEPPAGLRAGLLRSYNVVVDQDKLDRIETSQWRILLYTLCFLHSIVLERRKFGSLGWSIPYEFNTSDLSSSIMFLEKHLYSGALSWPTLQYMVSEVQYGGRITDDLDRRLFLSYCEAWLGKNSMSPSFTFNPDTLVGRMPEDFVYSIPDVSEVDDYHRFVRTFPKVDSPEIFGLHPNADFTFRTKEVSSLLDAILETQPQQQSSTSGCTREDVVIEKGTALLEKIPPNFEKEEYIDIIKNKLGGLEVPLNIFLYQEVQRLQSIISLVSQMLTEMQQAIQGEIVVTPEIVQTISALYDAKVPKSWVYSIGGDELSWKSSTLGLWFASFLDRYSQIKNWLDCGRPNSYWLTGFFNPQGFLTAMRQEVTRLHFNDKWALDDVVFHTEVTEYDRADQIRQGPKEGVFIHGLYLEGAAWNHMDGTLVESEPKVLFSALPALYVTAITKMQKKNRSGDYGPYGGYECPCYKYSTRTSQYLIFTAMMASRDHRPSHWVLRGVSLLCSTD